MRIVIEIIDHKNQRYDTCGDWWWEGETLQVRVSALSNVYRSFLIAFHEIFEAMWCLKNKVKQKDVDTFDQNFERDRQEGDDSEPGDQTEAPYYFGHQYATALERTAAVALGEDWESYNKEVLEL